MPENVTVRDLAAAVDGLANALAPQAPVAQICTDSRSLQPGDVFWALRGERHDGHDHCRAAMLAGASLCVVEGSHTAAPRDVPAVVVDDTLVALQRFAGWYRNRLDPFTICVTGSAGKTTTRSLLHAILASEYTGRQSPRNFNNHVGVPLTLLGLTSADEFLVCELGASAIGEIASLAALAQPEVGIVTSIGPAHLEGFGSLAGVQQGKGELCEAIVPGGFAVLPGDDPRTRCLAQRTRCRTIFVGESTENAFRATEVQVSAAGLSLCIEGQRVHVPVHGRHHVSNVLCAVAVAREIGLPLPQIAEALAEYRPIEGRAAVEQIGPWTVIDDSYNANPLSTAAACRLLAEFKSSMRRTIAVLGEMVELGNESSRYHRELGANAAAAGADWLLTCGTFSSDVAAGAAERGLDSYHIADCRDLDALLAVLDCWLEPGDVVLVKGSRLTRMERVVQWLRGAAAGDRAVQPRSELRACA